MIEIAEHTSDPSLVYANRSFSCTPLNQAKNKWFAITIFLSIASVNCGIASLIIAKIQPGLKCL
jgi:hypothetical protein